jgi:hypothetical protein
MLIYVFNIKYRELQMFKLLSLIPAMILVGCSTTSTLYSGEFISKVNGEDRKSIVYWSNSEHGVGADTNPNAFTLITECSTNVVRFEQTSKGFIFKKRTTDNSPIDNDKECGLITGVKSFSDLKENSSINLSIICENKKSAFSTANNDYPLGFRDIIMHKSMSEKLIIPKLECPNT